MVNDVNQEHGPHRRPMGVARTVVSSQTSKGWAGPTVAGYASGAQRCLLGFAHRRSLARSAPSLSSLSDLSSPLPAVAALGVAHPTAPETGRRLTRPREAGFEQSFIDASFSSAKKGALLSALLAAAKAAKS